MKHANNWNGDDRTLCGLALEGVCDGSDERPIEVARIGEFVACSDCRRVIDHAQACFTMMYRVRAESVGGK